MSNKLKEKKEDSIKKKLDSPYVKGVHLDVSSNLVSIEFQNKLEVQLKFKRTVDPRLDTVNISPLGMSKLGSTAIKLTGSEADKAFFNFCYNVVFNSDDSSFVSHCEYTMKKYREEKEII